MRLYVLEQSSFGVKFGFSMVDFTSLDLQGVDESKHMDISGNVLNIYKANKLARINACNACYSHYGCGFIGKYFNLYNPYLYNKLIAVEERENGDILGVWANSNSTKALKIDKSLIEISQESKKLIASFNKTIPNNRAIPLKATYTIDNTELTILNLVYLDHTVKFLCNKVRDIDVDKTVGNKNCDWSIENFKRYMDAYSYTYNIDGGVLSNIDKACKIVHVPFGISEVVIGAGYSDDREYIISPTVTSMILTDDSTIKIKNMYFQFSEIYADESFRCTGECAMEISGIAEVPCKSFIHGLYNNSKINKVVLKHRDEHEIVIKDSFNNSQIRKGCLCAGRVESSFNNLTLSKIKLDNIVSLEWSFDDCNNCKITLSNGCNIEHIKYCFNDCVNTRIGSNKIIGFKLDSSFNRCKGVTGDIYSNGIADFRGANSIRCSAMDAKEVNVATIHIGADFIGVHVRMHSDKKQLALADLVDSNITDFEIVDNIGLEIIKNISFKRLDTVSLPKTVWRIEDVGDMDILDCEVLPNLTHIGRISTRHLNAVIVNNSVKSMRLFDYSYTTIDHIVIGDKVDDIESVIKNIVTNHTKSIYYFIRGSKAYKSMKHMLGIIVCEVVDSMGEARDLVKRRTEPCSNFLKYSMLLNDKPEISFIIDIRNGSYCDELYIAWTAYNKRRYRLVTQVNNKDMLDTSKFRVVPDVRLNKEDSLIYHDNLYDIPVINIVNMITRNTDLDEWGYSNIEYCTQKPELVLNSNKITIHDSFVENRKFIIISVDNEIVYITSVYPGSNNGDFFMRKHGKYEYSRDTMGDGLIKGMVIVGSCDYVYLDNMTPFSPEFKYALIDAHEQSFVVYTTGWRRFSKEESIEARILYEPISDRYIQVLRVRTKEELKSTAIVCNEDKIEKLPLYSTFRRGVHRTRSIQ